jgi:hypothetical protein
VGILTTQGDVAFIGRAGRQPSSRWMRRPGESCGASRRGAAISSSPIAYKIGDEQYVAVYAGGTGIPYGNTAPRGDYLWAFKLDGTLPPGADAPRRRTSAATCPGSPVEGSTVGNTVLLARTSAPPRRRPTRPPWRHVPDAHARPGRHHGHLQEPGDEQEGALRHAVLRRPVQPAAEPGESFTYTFNTQGEYFYNDCTDPRPTGKIVVY